MLRTLIARSAHELDSLGPAWQRLDRSPRATLFQSWRWNRLAAQFFAAREQPCVVLVENDAGSALIPAARRRSGLTLLGETLFDYRDVLYDGDPDILRQAWAALAGFDLDFDFRGLRADSPVAWDWAGTQPFAAAPQLLRCDCDASSFAAAHTRSARLLRRLVHAGVELRRHNSPSRGLLRWIYERKGEQPAGEHPNLFADPLRVDFMVEAAASPATDVFTLETPGHIVAALVTFRDRAVRRLYTIYYDHAWARFSPGVALVREVARLSLAEGLDCDYMTGEQPHKTRFATSSVPLLRVSASAADLHHSAAEMLPAAA